MLSFSRKDEDANPDSVGEEKAAPTVVDYPEELEEHDLPADTTTAPDIIDTGYIWDQILPGDSSPMVGADKVRLLATRVTEVSDAVLFGAVTMGADEGPLILVPAHRDRLRVTVQNLGADGDPAVHLGQGPGMVAGFNAWALQPGDVITFRTRAVIYVQTVGGADTVTLQWASELVAEDCGIPDVT